jgi:hypothetical protein
MARKPMKKAAGKPAAKKKAVKSNITVNFSADTAGSKILAGLKDAAKYAATGDRSLLAAIHDAPDDLLTNLFREFSVARAQGNTAKANQILEQMAEVQRSVTKVAKGYADNNPKSAVARLKPGIHAVPFSALLHLGAAMADGKRKYGLTNWRGNEVAASVYVDAVFRHLAAWWDAREEVAPDSLVHHLGHVMACCSIILDAQATGNLIDDRPAVAGKFSTVVDEIIERTKQRLENVSA